MIPQQDTEQTSVKPIPPGVDDDQRLVIRLKGQGRYGSLDKRVEITDQTTVNTVKQGEGIDDAIAMYSDDFGSTIALNDDDRIADHLNDGDTLAFKPNAKFG